MDLKEIQNLIKFVSNSGVAEVKLETGDIKITIRTTLEGNSPDITYVQQAPMQQTMQQAAPVAPGDGGASFKASILATISSLVVEDYTNINSDLVKIQ